MTHEQSSIPRELQPEVSELLHALVAQVRRTNEAHDQERIVCMIQDLTDLVHRIVGGTLTNIERNLEQMNQELTDLTREVQESRTATDSVLALVEGLAQQIRDNATNPGALRALADDLDAQQAKIAAAVVANTPTQPTPPTP